MDVPAYMVGIGTFLAGTAGLVSLVLRRGEREPDDHDLADYWHAKYDECEERARAQKPPPSASKRRNRR